MRTIARWSTSLALCVAPVTAQDERFTEVGLTSVELHGIDAGRDGFRAKTPALQDSDYNLRQVDRNALHARARAMIEDGAVYRDMLPTLGYTDTTTGRKSEPAPLPVAPKEGHARLIALMTAFAIGLFLLARRARRA